MACLSLPDSSKYNYFCAEHVYKRLQHHLLTGQSISIHSISRITASLPFTNRIQISHKMIEIFMSIGCSFELNDLILIFLRECPACCLIINENGDSLLHCCIRSINRFKDDSFETIVNNNDVVNTIISSYVQTLQVIPDLSYVCCWNIFVSTSQVLTHTSPCHYYTSGYCTCISEVKVNRPSHPLLIRNSDGVSPFHILLSESTPDQAIIQSMIQSCPEACK